jgi:hypothetical protein
MMPKPLHDLQSLIESSRRADHPTPSDRAHVQAALAAKLGDVALGVKVASSAAAGTSIAPGAAAVTVSLLTKVLAVSALVAVTGIAVVVARSGHPHGRTPIAAHSVSLQAAAPPTQTLAQPFAIAPQPVAPARNEVAVSPAVAPVRVQPRTSAPIAAREHTEAPMDEPPEPVVVAIAPPSLTVNAEVAALSAAQHALRSGDATGALARLDAYAAEFPHGTLRQEHSATRVLVLCALGRRDEARSEAQSFLQDAAQSPLAARIRASCAGGE